MVELTCDDYKRIGARIRDIRESQGLSQMQLAEKAYLSAPKMSDVELGKARMRLSTFIHIAEALQVSADSILRLNIPEVIQYYKSDFDDLLSDCTPDEIELILKVAGDLKKTMHSKKANTDY